METPGSAIPALTWGFVAEREGFEPPGHLHARLLSRQLQSTRLCHRSQPVRRARMTGRRPCRLCYSSTRNPLRPGYTARRGRHVAQAAQRHPRRPRPGLSRVGSRAGGPHAARVRLAGSSYPVGIRACRHRRRTGGRRALPVGRLAGPAPPSGPALAMVADRHVPRGPGGGGDRHPERHRRLRRRAVLGPHDPAPAADHGRAAAAGGRRAVHPAAAREQEPAAQLGQTGDSLPGGQLPHLAAVRARRLHRDDHRRRT